MRKSLKDKIKTIIRELRPHALWDLVKLVLFLLGGSGLMTLAYRLLAWFRDQPQDRITDLVIFGSSVFLLALAFAIGRYRRSRFPDTTLKQEQTAPKDQNTEQTVEILTPLDLRNVGWRQIVHGSVFPPDSDVQVLVYSPDELWYMQGPVDVKGCSWSCRCQFGDKGKPGRSYDIVAAFGKSLKLEKYEHLPEGLIKSKAITVNRNSDEDIIDCPDKQLHQTKIDDKSAIKDLVKVCVVKCETNIIKGGPPPYVDFGFWILSLSLHPVSVKSVNGYITFQKDATGDSIELEGVPKISPESRATNLAFRTDGWFRIRQPLDKNQVDWVESGSDQSLFYFHNLNIMVEGNGFEPVRLDVEKVQKRIPYWAQDACKFVYATVAEATAKIRELEGEKLSLKSQRQRLINGLPIRLIHAKPDYSSNPKLIFPSKVRCEFENISGVSIKIRNSEWIPGAGGVMAEMPATTLQIRIAGKWYPPEEIEEIHVAPGERFRNWIAPGKQFTENELQRRCVAKELGTVVFLVDGREVRVPV
jgi:hypothetical protein